MMSGELIVTGTNNIQFQLSGKPIRVAIDFSDSNSIIIPCNPQSNDKLDWIINGNILTINWEVYSVREVTWKVWMYWNEL
ncbi:MAG TPA: hypothetical protein VII94_05990 [Candidatus Saccharimonadales bacterium]